MSDKPETPDLNDEEANEETPIEESLEETGEATNDEAEQSAVEEVTADAESESEDTSGTSNESGSEDEQLNDLENIEFPEASFDMLLMQHHTQAMLALGMIPDPATGQVIKNKSAAKFHIDMLAIIQERTTGNLSQGEEEALNGVLHSLRMMFVNAG